jgi:heptosyltransferase-1
MGQGVDLLGAIARIVPERPPPPFSPARLDEVLLIKLSSIGDVVHALPVASALKRAHPAMRITWAAEDWTAPLVTRHPAIDRVVAFPAIRPRALATAGWRTRFRSAMRELRSVAFDVAVDLQGLARSASVSRAARARLRVARAGQREGAHLVSFGIPLDGARHAVEEYLAVAAYLGTSQRPVTFGLQPRQPPSAALRQALAATGENGGDALIVVNPSAAQRNKHWPLDHWSTVIDALSDAGSIVIVGGTGNRQAHAALVARCRSRPLDLTGLTTLDDVVWLLKHARLHVAPDTGTLHIAAAMATPVVAVYGPTSPARVGPWAQLDHVVHHRQLCGRGCPAYCRFGRRCLAAVTPAEMIAKAHGVLAAPRPS